MDKRLVNIIFGVSLVILLLLSILAYNRLGTFKRQVDTVDTSNEVLLAISDLRWGYNSVVSDQRSYLLTKNRANMHQFHAEKDSLRHILEVYRQLTRSNAVHTAYARKLHTLANKRIQSLLVEVINDTSTARYKYDQRQLIAQNEEIDRTYFSILSTIYTHEKQMLKRREREKQFEEQFAPFLLFLLALVALVIITYLFNLLSNELEERQAATELLEEYVDNLNRSNKELEAYAYVASHDLQEPLRKIRMFSDMLLNSSGESSGEELTEQSKQLLRRMNDSSEKMTGLIKDLLSFSKLSAADMPLERIDLNEVVSEVLEEFDHKLVDFSVDLGKLPVIAGIRGQLFQLFQNLISNSIKFRRTDTASFIRFRGYEKALYEGDTRVEYYLIVVKDNGLGFDNQYKDKMFSIFGRLEATSGIEGTGIGLSVCSRIMQNHNGKMDASGELNAGAEFHLFFPKYH